MLYIPRIGDYLQILIDEEIKDFVAINLREYFKSTRENTVLEKLLNRFITF